MMQRQAGRVESVIWARMDNDGAGRDICGKEFTRDRGEPSSYAGRNASCSQLTGSILMGAKPRYA
jgi:hypothetical protein